MTSAKLTPDARTRIFTSPLPHGGFGRLAQLEHLGRTGLRGIQTERMARPRSPLRPGAST